MNRKIPDTPNRRNPGVRPVLMQMIFIMAERTGFEPATSTVTVWRSNQLSYRSILLFLLYSVIQGEDILANETIFVNNKILLDPSACCQIDLTNFN